MTRIVRFKRFINMQTVSGDAVYLYSERPGQVRLSGELMQRMAPLLDGLLERQEIVAKLSAEFGEERVVRAIDRLIDLGYATEVDVQEDSTDNGFWGAVGVDGDVAGSLAGTPLGLKTFGDVTTDEFLAAASSLGLSIGTEYSGLTVVLTDDYLQDGLAEFNRDRLAAGRPWLLARPVGTVIWLGPIFVPGRTGCWQCLATRLANNQMLLTYLRQHTKQSSARLTSTVDLPGTRRLAGELITLHVGKWLSGAVEIADNTASVERTVEESRLGGVNAEDLFTLDTITLDSHTHRLQRRPQCAECGDPELQARLHRQPVRLLSRAKTSHTDGGHRAKSPEALLAEFEPLISPITGVVKQLVRVPTKADDLYTYNAGQNFAVPMAGIADLRAGLRSAACGKGITDQQAKASALAEAIERYSGLYRGDEERITATISELAGDAIAPNDVHLYSERQYANRSAWNAKGSHFQRVCDPFDPAKPIEWTPVWSLTNQRTRYLPTGTLFFGYPMAPGNMYTGADSNGNAAGSSLEDATLQGFLELVERDSVALWWYNMLSRPAIDLDSFPEPYFAKWQQRYHDLNRETWALDLTTDLGIPTVVAVSRRTDKRNEDILIAFGAHFDISVAIARAMTEMNQFLPAVVNASADEDRYEFPDPDQHHWWRTATVQNQPYLLPSGESPRVASDYSDPTGDDLRDDVRLAEKIVSGAGMEMLVLNQTRPDIGLPVVKVIVPGMRHFWTRFAPGRLYDVPVRMGWLKQATSEEDLNPIGMFL